MIFKAIPSSRTGSKQSRTTVPFPIPGSEYGHAIGVPEGMGSDPAAARDYWAGVRAKIS